MPSDHVVLYGCKYTPVELLAGFDASCEVAELDADSFEEAERLAHVNLCGYGKGMLERMLAPDCHEAVLVSCCDVVKRVYDVLVEQDALDFCFLLDLPHRDRGPERDLLRARLEELAHAYAAYSGARFDLGRALAACVPAVPRHDERVAILGAHATRPLVDATQACLGMAVENLTCTGDRTLPAPPSSLARPRPQGGCGTCDAQASGPSDPSNPSDEADDDLARFLDWYAGALLGQVPCIRMDDTTGRERLLGEPGQLGVVYHTMKFCDYYGFEYARELAGSAIPSVRVETDGSSQSSGQVATRLEAFAETLGSREGRSAAMPVKADGSRGTGYVVGIDSGSTSTDAVVLGRDGAIRGSAIVATGMRAGEAAKRAEAEALEVAGIGADEVDLRVATGYGRDGIAGMDSSITEITCHAAGAHILAPEARTVIDIGGQDSKIIHLDEDGSVLSFMMNDKCAAGTGRFLETMARAMELPIGQFCALGLDWRHDVRISSMCTVFAESEVVSLVADGTPAPDIVHGLNTSVAKKTSTLAKRAGAEPPYIMTGGVARNAGVVAALSDVLGAPVATHEDSQLCGALGAAVLGLRSLGAGSVTGSD